jgi:predicted transcriptional regulator of viral defense system
LNHEMHGRKHPRTRDIADLAVRQHGVVSYGQLIAMGFGRGAIDHRVATRQLHPIHRGVYAVGHRKVGYLGRWMGGVLACGPDALLSHQPAAALLELRPTSSAAIHVTAPGRTRRGPRGITVHRPRKLHPDDRTIVDSIPVTSVARTILDNAETLPPRQLIRVIEQAERIAVFDLNAIHALIDRSSGRRGLKPLRQALAEITGEPPHTNST